MTLKFYPKQFYVLVRSSIHSKAEEYEFTSEEEAIAEAMSQLKRGMLVEMGEEYPAGF